VAKYDKDHHHFQREKVKFFSNLKPVLNAACKEDPGGLAQLGTINLDCCRVDKFTNCKLDERVPNFVLGSVFNMHMFHDKQFGVVVLGEFLEHCTEAAARRAFLECKRVLQDEGRFVLTFPLDKRKPEEQHSKDLLFEWAEGITSYHQTVWDDVKLFSLYADCGFEEIERVEFNYGFATGFGLTLRKKL
jgi:SAM-dependent methyltransferase